MSESLKNLTRRDLLKFVGITALSPVISACSDAYAFGEKVLPQRSEDKPIEQDWTWVEDIKLDPSGYKAEKLTYVKGENNEPGKWVAEDGSTRSLVEENYKPQEGQPNWIFAVPVPVRKPSIDGLPSGVPGIGYKPLGHFEVAK